MRIACAIALLFAAGCVRDNPRFGDGQASTGTSAGDATSAGSTTGIDTTDPTGSTDASDSDVPNTTGSDSDASSSSGDIPESPHCEGEAILVEPFDRVPVDTDEWLVSTAPSIGVSETQGGLNVAFDQSSGYWVMRSVETVPERGSLGFQVRKAADPEHPIQVLVGLADGERILQFSLALGALDISWWEAGDATSATANGPINYDAGDHQWMRMSFDTAAGEAWGELSRNGFDWTEAFSVDLTPLALDQTRFHLSVGAWANVPNPDFAVIDNAFACVE